MAAFEASAPEDRLTRRAERELIAAGCAALRLDPTPEQIERLLGLVDALERGNARFNLTAIRDRPGMLRKHVLDSLTLHDYLSGKRVADVGTGAGFPGLPLAIVDPGRRFTLIEATGKKAQYVAATARELGCTNVEVVNERAERYRPFERFDVVTARALASLADIIAYGGHLCAPGGRLIAMKGKRPEGEITALPKSFRLVAVHRIRVPGLDEERHLVELSPSAERRSTPGRTQ
jgi:16S rRNA (guanine527-N7)-methyltransferase